MAAYYLDSSALVKRYIAETGSGWLRQLTDPTQSHVLYTAAVAGPEMIAALVRRARGGQIPASAARHGVANVRLDWRSLYTIVAVDETVIARAMDVAELHGLRGYDAVHVAAALSIQDQRQASRRSPLTFISADQQQLTVASSEGMTVDDPNQHP